MYQKWPDQIFFIVNFVFSHYGHFGLGGWGRGPPPLVFNYSKEALGGGGVTPRLIHVALSWAPRALPGGGGGGLGCLVRESHRALLGRPGAGRGAAMAHVPVERRPAFAPQTFVWSMSRR